MAGPVTYEALVHVVDPDAFVEEAYAARNSLFRQATVIEDAGVEGRTVSAPGRVMSVRSEDRRNVEDVLLVDLGMDPADVDEFIKEVRLTRASG